jgi:hypothetical protein
MFASLDGSGKKAKARRQLTELIHRIQCGCLKCRFANATPEPDFGYLTNTTALFSSNESV